MNSFINLLIAGVLVLFGSSTPASQTQPAAVATTIPTQTVAASTPAPAPVVVPEPEVETTQPVAPQATVAPTVTTHPSTVVHDTITYVPSGLSNYVSSSTFNLALADLRTDLLAHIVSTAVAPTTQISQQVAANGFYSALNVTPISPPVNNLSNTTISDPTITGGSISSSSLVGTITNAINSALATIDNLTTKTITAINFTTTNATTTNLAATNASLTNAQATNLTVTATSTLNGVTLSNTNCSSLGNGGKLTTDVFGVVICAADQGGAGGTAAGTSTQIQFNNAGSFGASANLTFNGSYLTTPGFLSLASSTVVGNFFTTGMGTFGSLTSGSSTLQTANITNLVTPGLPNLTSNVEGTNLPGIDGGHWFIWNNPSTFDSEATLRVDRRADTGTGASGSTYKSIWGVGTSGPYNAGFEWTITGELHNKSLASTGSQNVAVNGTAFKEANGIGPVGSTWGGNFVCNDMTGMSNPTGSCVGTEIDSTWVTGSGGDSNKNRVVLQLAWGGNTPSSTNTNDHISYGILMGSNDASVMDTGIEFDGLGAYGVGIDFSKASAINTAAVLLSSSKQNTISWKDTSGTFDTNHGFNIFAAVDNNWYFSNDSNSTTIFRGQGADMRLALSSTTVTSFKPMSIGTTTTGTSLSIQKGGNNSIINMGQMVGNGDYSGISFSSMASSSVSVTTSNYNILGDGHDLLLGRIAGGAIRFRENNGSDQLVLLSGGNVGVGITTPTQKLDVAGNINVSSGSAYLYNGLTIVIASTTLNNYFSGGSGNLTMTGTSNTGNGYQSLNSDTLGSYNTANGFQSLYSNTIGSNNVADGLNSLYNNTSGSSNTSSGLQSLFSNTTGSYNTATGQQSLFYNTGGNNTANGFQSLYSNTTGSSNVAIGFQSLSLNTSATSSVVEGYQAARGVASYNNQGSTVVGYESGYSFATGSDYNTLLGYQSGFDISTGSNNIILGPQQITGTGLTTGSGNILIGNSVSNGLVKTGNNQLNIGNLLFGTGLSSGAALSSGNVGIGTSTPGSLLSLGGIANFTTATSTFYGTGGVNLTSGCFSINGTCIGTGGTGVTSLTATYPLIASAAAGSVSLSLGFGTTTANTWSSLQTFTSGLISNASSTFAAVLNANTLNLANALGIASGGTGTSTQVTNGVNYFNGSRITSGTGLTFNGVNLGIGTTSLLYAVSIQPASGVTPFVVASSTGETMLSVNSDGTLNAKLKQLTADYMVDSGSANISVGDIVAYINGKAEKASAAITNGTPVVVNNVNSTYESAAKLDSTHFVLGYLNSSTAYAEAVIGTISGTTITYGTPVTLSSFSPSYVSVTALDSTHFVMGYVDSGSYAEAVAGTVSGTTITHGMPSVLNYVRSENTSVTALTSTHFVMGYQNGNTGYAEAVIGTVSGTTIAHGTPVVLNGIYSYYISVTTLDSTHFVMGYQNGATAEAVIGSVLGTGITPGIPVTLNSVSSLSTSVTALDSGHFVMGYQNGGTGHAEAVIGSVSGTAIAHGTPVVLNSVSSLSTSVTALDSTHFVMGYQNNSNGYAEAVIGSVSGTAITPGTPVTLNSVSSLYTSVTALDSTRFVMGYQNGSTGYAEDIIAQSSIGHSNNSSNLLGMATKAASANGTVTVATNGIVSGLSGLTAGSTYYWSGSMGLSTTTQAYKVGIALSATSILLNSSNGAGNDQFFGDAVFANDFRITESPDGPQGLIFKNQLGREVLHLDESGNLDLSGVFNGTLGITALSSLFSTSTALAATSSDVIASSTPSIWWSGNSFLSLLFDHIVAWLADSTNGISDLFAKNLHATNVTADTGTFKKELCIGTTCVTEDQLKALLAAANQSGTSPAASTANSVSVGAIAPQIQINGANPAVVNVGDVYNDLGAVITAPAADTNLNIITYVNGLVQSPILIDTSTTSTSTIDYVVTDPAGLTSTSTRTVIVQ